MAKKKYSTKKSTRTVSTPLYKNKQYGIERRVRDLLSRMTVEEKVAQLSAFAFFDAEADGIWYFDKTLDKRIETVKKIPSNKVMAKKTWGHFCVLVRDLPARDAAEKVNEVHRAACEKTRLGIPPIIHDEGLHGLHCNGATTFPQAIAMASSWNPSLLEKVAHIIGKNPAPGASSTC